MDYQEFKATYQKKEVCEYANMVAPNPLVSVCIQTYQHAPFIIKCLDGILGQRTTFPFEILIGEDGSYDGTREICIKYAEKYPDIIRLFLHHRENNISINGHPSGRFNFLYNLFNARGKYIAICEGDDFWVNSYKLQKQVYFMEANPDYSLSVGRVDMLNEATGKIEIRDERINLDNKDTFSAKDFLIKPFSQTSSFLFIRNNLDFPNWLFRVHAGDQSLVIITTRYGGKIKYHRDLFSIYRVHSGSITRTATYDIYKKFSETLEDWYIYLNKSHKLIFLMIKYRNFFSWKIKKSKSNWNRWLCLIIVKIINFILKLFYRL